MVIIGDGKIDMLSARDQIWDRDRHTRSVGVARDHDHAESLISVGAHAIIFGMHNVWDALNAILFGHTQHPPTLFYIPARAA